MSDLTKKPKSEGYTKSDAKHAPKPPRQSARRRFIRWALLVVLANCLWLLGAQRYFPEVIESALDSLMRKPVVVPLGAVTGVHYIVGISPDTQVDTVQRSMLLRGTFNVVNGELLEAHMNGNETKVCVVASERCTYWYGDHE